MTQHKNLQQSYNIVTGFRACTQAEELDTPPVKSGRRIMHNLLHGNAV
jgi:hypothetical protein